MMTLARLQSAPTGSDSPLLESSNCATMPCPATAVNWEGATVSIPRSAAARTTALPIGCSLPRSAEAASCRRNLWCPCPSLSRAMMSVSVNSPCVKVPVLSRTTADNFPARSNDSVFLKRMPRCAPMPVPTITAVGVASPNAHGHAITSTATNRSIAGVNPSPTNTHHARNVAKAIPITTGTNTLATVSAVRWIGALLCCVACTS